MNYRSNNGGEDLSILGFGCMRFPKNALGIDYKETLREIDYAIKSGINYFDTAYIYPGSEETLGKCLEELGCRDQVKIATKLPHYLLKKPEDIERYFQEQLKRLKTDYVDYYLMHMLTDVNVWNKLVDMGILDWIQEKKDKGQIRHIGFSFHGNTDTFLKLLDAYSWEFCQIQYNYIDEFSQAGVRGLKAAYEKNIPVIIMEPLRGGRLATGLPKKAVEAFEGAKEGRHPAEWAFRWLWNQPEVTVVLSGMNSMEMLEENIRAASSSYADMIDEDEKMVYDQVKDIINHQIKVPCTGCSYCMPCPKGVDIPGAFRCYNASYTDGYGKGIMEYFMCTSMRPKENRSNAGQCIGCGKCEQHCPQGIQIRNELKQVKKRFENPVFKLGSVFASKMYRGK